MEGIWVVGGDMEGIWVVGGDREGVWVVGGDRLEDGGLGVAALARVRVNAPAEEGALPETATYTNWPAVTFRLQRGIKSSVL